MICSLYRGKVGLDAAEAQHLMESLDWPGAVKDISESVKWLKENGSPKVCDSICLHMSVFYRIFICKGSIQFWAGIDRNLSTYFYIIIEVLKSLKEFSRKFWKA